MHRLLIYIALLLPSVLYGQPNQAAISGTVICNGEAVIGANIRFQDLNKGTSTDTTGAFIIENIEPGTYTLVVSAVGYQTYKQSISVKSGETISLDIKLTEAMGELDEVVVTTGTMRETYVKDSPVKVSVVKPARLQQGNASANFMDLVDHVNGLSTQLNCGVCGTNAIRINGVEGPNTAVLIDGMPVMGALASVYGLNGISPSIIDQIEVIKGPQSTLYGTQALGGVINIITKNPANTPTFSADLYGKSTREGNLNIAASPDIGRFQGFISGNLVRMEHYFDHNNDNFNDVPKRSRAALFGKGTLKGPHGEDRLNVALKLYGEDRTGGVESFTDDVRGSDEIYGESIYTRRAELLTDYRPAGFDQRLRIGGALTHHEQDSYYGTERYDARQQIAFGQATWNQQLTDALSLLSGATLRYETYNDNTPATSGGATRRLIPGVFSQGEYSLGDATLLAGLRVDHHSEHGYVTAPRFSAKYSPDPRTTFRLSSGTGFRVVNVFTEDHAALTGSRNVVFTEDLEPEQSRSLTASFEHILPLNANPLTISVDGFYTRFSNKIIPDYDQDPNLIVYENLDGFSVTRGASIELAHNFTALPVSYNAGFTLMDVYIRENGSQQALTYAPKFMGSIGASWHIQAADMDISYSGNLTGPKRMPDNYVENFGRNRWSPTYTTHDLKITREFTNVNSDNGIGIEGYISVENLFDFTQGSPLVDAATPFSPQFDTIYTWGPIVGRTFTLGARLNLR